MMNRKFNPRPISDSMIWKETAEKLSKYFSNEGFTYADIIEVIPYAIKTFNRLLYNRKKSELDLAIILENFEKILTEYYSEEGFTYINIYEAFRPAWDLFEKLLYDGVED